MYPLRALAVAVSIAMLSAVPASTASPVDVTTDIDYRVGGGRPLMRAAGPEMWNPRIGIGGSFGNPGQCNAFEPDAAILGSFSDGDWDRFQRIVLERVRQVFNPQSIAMLALQRSNPDLYEYIQEGLANANAAFSFALGSCEDYQKQLGDMVPSERWETLSMGQELNQAARTAKEEVDEGVSWFNRQNLIQVQRGLSGGNEGVEVAGVQKGGAGQNPVETVADVSRAGFNAITERSPAAATPVTDDQRYPIIEHFDSPAAAAEYITTVVGETRFRTCDDCQRVDAEPGAGIHKLLQDTSKDVTERLVEALRRDPGQMTEAELEDINQGTSLVTVDMLYTLQRMEPHTAGAYVAALSKEVAMAVHIDKLMMARRVLHAGLKEGTIKDNDLLYQEAQSKLDDLTKEIDLLEQEIRIKRSVTKEAGSALIERRRIMDAGASLPNKSHQPIN